MIIKNSIKTIILALFTLLISTSVYSNENAEKSSKSHEEKEFNVGETIMHHIQDAHEWHLWGGHENSVSIYLPIILMDGGMKVFSSSHFYHGTPMTGIDEESGKEHEYVVGVGPAAGYAMFHETIYKLEGGELHFKKDHPHNVAPLDFSITKNVVSIFLTFLILILVMFSVAKYYRKNGAVAPKGIAKFIEPLIVFVRDDIAKANINAHKYKKYVPFLLTIFFFILVSNLTGLIPLVQANVTGNITVTLFLATCTLLVTVFSGNKNYWGHIFATPGVPKALLVIMVPIELVGVLTKPFALMIRLFANISAGHIIILALVSIIFLNKAATWGFLSVPMSLFISVLEILVAFLQAYLFAMLSALFIGAAVEEAHH
jgi:F-type H+-transporting ATPase subunit a